MKNNVIEEFKPVPQRQTNGLWGRLFFHVRSAIDLQALTIYRFARPFFDEMHGKVLDVGCGEMPYRSLLPADAEYKGIDVAAAVDFEMATANDVTVFDGVSIPFQDNTFDYIICTEVLEHATQPELLVTEIHRVLRPGGTLVMTMPFAARVHFIPHDYRRLTSYGLTSLLSGFRDVIVTPRGNDISVIANKLVVTCMRMMKPGWRLVFRLPGILFFGILSVIFLALAHLSFAFGWGSVLDPLGYGAIAKK